MRSPFSTAVAGSTRDPSRGALRAIAAAVIVCMLAATPALAQMWYLFPEGFSLSKEDIDVARNTANQLLAIDPPAIGRSVTWSNPKSGAHGTIILESASEVRGLPCRRIRYLIVAPGTSSALELAERICRTPDGSWKFL